MHVTGLQRMPRRVYTYDATLGLNGLDFSSTIPGRVTRMVIEAARPGGFRGQCAEYCGAQHSLMALNVTALSRAEFDAWVARLAEPVREPPTSDLRQGRDLFVSLGRGGCHSVRGLADTRLGPDLTQVGARPMIGAGTLPGGAWEHRRMDRERTASEARKRDEVLRSAGRSTTACACRVSRVAEMMVRLAGDVS
jgi:hypothetical protein